jgi:hypothetical protein
VDCRQWFWRIIEIQEPKIQLGKRIRKTTPASSRERFKQAIVEGNGYDEDETAEDEDEDEAEIQQFRRVQVVHNNTVPVQKSINTFNSSTSTMSESPRELYESIEGKFCALNAPYLGPFISNGRVTFANVNT